MVSVIGDLRKEEMIEMTSLQMKGMELERAWCWEGDHKGYSWKGSSSSRGVGWGNKGNNDSMDIWASNLRNEPRSPNL